MTAFCSPSGLKDFRKSLGLQQLAARPNLLRQRAGQGAPYVAARPRKIDQADIIDSLRLARPGELVQCGVERMRRHDDIEAPPAQHGLDRVLPALIGDLQQVTEQRRALADDWCEQLARRLWALCNTWCSLESCASASSTPGRKRETWSVVRS